MGAAASTVSESVQHALGVEDKDKPLFPTANGEAHQPYDQSKGGQKAVDEGPIRLAANVPIKFTPFKSTPRGPGETPFKRLVLISSRVHDCHKVAETVSSNAAVILYDWRVFTLQELLRSVKKVLGGGTVLSIAVVAPGSKPGTVGLLEGSSTSAEKLEPCIIQESTDGKPQTPSHPLQANSGEVAQFWRALSACCKKNEKGEGQRVDLLGCRMQETPEEGAALLRVLAKLTSVPYAAADNASTGYQLMTCYEDSRTKKVSLRKSTLKALGLYFNKAKLLNLVKSSAAAAAEEGRQHRRDIFVHFARQIQATGVPLSKIFNKYNTNSTGFLTDHEINNLVRDACPDASEVDVQHVALMLDLDGNSGVTLSELQLALREDCKIEQAVLEGRDDSNFMPALCKYMSENVESFKQYFTVADTSGDGALSHKELVGLVNKIPELYAHERKYLVCYFYQLGSPLKFDKMLRAVRSFVDSKQGEQQQQQQPPLSHGTSHQPQLPSLQPPQITAPPLQQQALAADQLQQQQSVQAPLDQLQQQQQQAHNVVQQGQQVVDQAAEQGQLAQQATQEVSQHASQQAAQQGQQVTDQAAEQAASQGQDAAQQASQQAEQAAQQASQQAAAQQTQAAQSAAQQGQGAAQQAQQASQEVQQEIAAPMQEEQAAPQSKMAGLKGLFGKKKEPAPPSPPAPEQPQPQGSKLKGLFKFGKN